MKATTTEEDHRKALLDDYQKHKTVANKGLRRRIEQEQNITEHLRRTRQIIMQEVDRTATTLQAIEDSSTVLEKTTTEHRSVSSGVSTAKKILTRLQTREATDKFLIFLSVLFFLLVVLYILKKRLMRFI
eukprot:TRINITY_DN2318_c0_g1_i1.p1 TRINITY_DN2318_c0_g1~~TRINITY_DN2318_c0_g1_i1.p1  ORF type:complete len:130 (-),score=25.11 TRINITY_DN2318_c0_g1_i1:21-410(-)